MLETRPKFAPDELHLPRFIPWI